MPLVRLPVFKTRLIAGLAVALGFCAQISVAEAGPFETISTKEDKGHYSTSAKIVLPKTSPKVLWDYHKGVYEKQRRSIRETFENDPSEIKRAKEFAPHSFDMAVKTSFYNDAIVSSIAEFGTYTGGAHGFEWTRGELFDANSGFKMSHDMIFEDFYDGSETVKTLVELLKKKIVIRKINKGWLEPGTQDEFVKSMEDKRKWVDNFALIAARDDESLPVGLLFFFDPYEVGPYAEGSHQIYVESDEVRVLLTPFAKDLLGDGDPAWQE